MSLFHIDAEFITPVQEYQANRSLTWDYNCRNEIYQDAGNTSWDEGNQKRQAEPGSANSEKFSQASTYPKDNSVSPGTA
jgi:hypothetical protein